MKLYFLIMIKSYYRSCVERAVFVNDEESVFITEVEDVFARRIVGATVGVRAHFLELFDAEFLNGSGDCGADAGMVLMVADSFELGRLAVDGEPVREVELEYAESEVDRFLVKDARLVL